MTGGVAVVGAVPPEADRNAPRAAAALLATLSEQGVPACSVLLDDDEAIADAIAKADAIVVVATRPVHAELPRLARLAAQAPRLVLVPQGYGFCEIATRSCERCPLARGCPASDRVAVHGQLAARAQLIVYGSSLQRAQSEAFVGAYPDNTRVIEPLDTAAIVDAITGVVRGPRVEPVPRAPLGRVLLYAHHVGLGDSVNLAAVARSLVHAGTPVTLAVPDAHHALVGDRRASTIDRGTAQEHDLVVEVTIRASDAFAGDLVEARWLQLALEQQPSALVPMHEQFLGLFARAGRVMLPQRPEITLAPEELAGGREQIATAGPERVDLERELVVAIHPGAGQPGKRWAAPRFAELARHLAASGARIVVVGGPGEEAIVDEVAAAGAALASKSAPLREVASLLAAATLVIANDSGLMHVASAVGTPALGIFGPTSERLWGPTHAYAAAVRARVSDPRRALEALDVDAVLHAFEALARRVAAEPPLHADRRIVASPRLSRTAAGETVQWHGRGTVSIEGPDPVAPIVAACDDAPRWATLVDRFDGELLVALLAAEIIVPAWSARLAR